MRYLWIILAIIIGIWGSIDVVVRYREDVSAEGMFILGIASVIILAFFGFRRAA